MKKLRLSRTSVDVADGVESAATAGETVFGHYNVQTLREKRMTMALRSVSFGLFGSILLNLVLGFVIVGLFPLKEVRPFLVQLADEGRIAAAINPIQDVFDAKDILTEKLVREYVVSRLEVVRSDEVLRARWGAKGMIGLMSATDEYDRFVDEVEAKVNAIRELNGEVRAEIVNVTPIKIGSTYVVDARVTTFNERNRQLGEPIEIAVTLDIDFLPLTGLTYEQLLINPTGFTVLNFLISEKN